MIVTALPLFFPPLNISQRRTGVSAKYCGHNQKFDAHFLQACLETRHAQPRYARKLGLKPAAGCVHSFPINFSVEDRT
jgi:hypothetical protein